jgi:GTP-binding protein
MPLLQHAIFLKSASAMGDLPGDSVAEVAIGGRSNSGKSSAINALANRRRLAYISKTPGRTQEINYFRITDGKYLVDLPGYGYAKVPGNVQRQWHEFLNEFLQVRAPLAGLLLVMDARHPLTENDANMLNWFAPTGKPVHILLTKADKLTRQQAARVLRDVRAAVEPHYPHFSVQLFSSVDRLGLEEAESVIARWLGIKPEKSNKKPPVKGE